jgi:serine/threonine protein kinase
LLVPGTYTSPLSVKLRGSYHNREERTRADIEQFSKVRVKIADLGNACWTHKHFTSDIQTRQYRAPEVIVGRVYSTPVDIWSTACIVFELATGDLLFEPKAGRTHTKNDDHLAQMLELLEKRRVPTYLTRGKYSADFFNRRGELRAIRPTDLKPWGLLNVLSQKYKMDPADAAVMADFITPMLDLNSQTRVTSKEALMHPWMQ